MLSPAGAGEAICHRRNASYSVFWSPGTPLFRGVLGIPLAAARAKTAREQDVFETDFGAPDFFLKTFPGLRKRFADPLFSCAGSYHTVPLVREQQLQRKSCEFHIHETLCSQSFVFIKSCVPVEYFFTRLCVHDTLCARNIAFTEHCVHGTQLFRNLCCHRNVLFTKTKPCMLIFCARESL